MTEMMNDLDLINAELAGGQGPRNAFGRDVQPGDDLTGTIIAAERRHRTVDGQPLYWVDRKPSTIQAGPAVMDSTLIIQTDTTDDEDDDGQRYLRLDRDVKKALTTALAAAGVKGVAIGGRIEGFTYLGKESTGPGRRYDGGTYTPPAA
ncbi:hypothetical protein [Nocardia sp. CC227C]|uniref:hypothetical protein n=1 Tax=Nocardia sp. CC227C TaxID=3044562 RepID=UPI00278C3E63|nr:hypothetical protein [Nocardia sp. CC227C]